MKEMNEKQDCNTTENKNDVIVREKENDSLASIFNPSNVSKAQQHAINLMKILVKSRKKIVTVGDLVFSYKEVIRSTTMSHKEARDLLNTLQIFGMLIWCDEKKQSFVLRIDMRQCLSVLLEETMLKSEILKDALERYVALVNVCDDKTVGYEERNEMINYAKTSVLKTVFGEDCVIKK